MMPDSIPSSVASLEAARSLRAALGQFATGVAIVTACDDLGRRAGVTINSFASVSLDPPLVLWSLAATASSRSVLESAPLHAINVLAANQAWLALRFARPAPDRFAGVAWRYDPAGAITIDGARAHFVSLVRERNPAGDHVLFICEVVRHGRSDGAPLIFHGSRYWTIGSGVDRPDRLAAPAMPELPCPA
jgi:unspecific monooxygenase